jgi:3-hydroxyacyl-[acyl-carrier-protein] dehydratase
MDFGPLYQILRICDEVDSSSKVDIQLNTEHAIFKGHFPGNPVLPGACMVQMLKEVLQQVRHCRLELKQGSNIKFIAVIVPDINPLLTFHIQAKTTPDGLLSINSTLYAGEVASMKFSGTYTIK